jgi:hypothetical protein
MFRNRLIAVAAVFATAAVIAGLVTSGASTQSARAGSLTKGLSAYVALTNTESLPACSEDGSDCTPANQVFQYVHVVNRSPLTNLNGNRLTVPNAFNIDSIDESVFVNGVHQDFDVHWTPPPNITPPAYTGYSARWPATVVCDGSPPCSDVQNPAVVPGEDTAAFITGWIHGDAEPNGVYVFTFRIHGTLNGNAVDLAASSAPIRMTG